MHNKLNCFVCLNIIKLFYLKLFLTKCFLKKSRYKYLVILFSKQPFMFIQQQAAGSIKNKNKIYIIIFF